ncbi:hypothetical protein C8R44DRAFT_673506 [Mycena epipterygia]|nr:hypothetical protein C8R44DRAFT_673506 [Mycena epipterygia]
MDVDTEQPASEPERVQELWFEDGNLIIQAGDRQFRVYRGILAARSPVFRDMLAFPQPLDSELIEGCPVVRLPDAATEVTVFLQAIFDPDFFMAFPAPTTFDIIVGCLRLSNKYEVDSLRRRALVHLSSGYRTTLVEADSARYDDDDPNPNRPPSEIESWPTPESLTSRLCVIQLAREVDALWVLPLAFYNLAAILPRIGSDIFHGAVYNGVPVSLSLQDQKSFLFGHDFQLRSTNADIMGFLTYPHSDDIKGCESPTRCTAERFIAIDRSREMISAGQAIPLDAWRSEDWDMLDELCPACLTVLKETYQYARQIFWGNLPETYGLPPWKELENLKEAALGKGSAVL